jgi:hypothetical protein
MLSILTSHFFLDFELTFNITFDLIECQLVDQSIVVFFGWVFCFVVGAAAKTKPTT